MLRGWLRSCGVNGLDNELVQRGLDLRYSSLRRYTFIPEPGLIQYIRCSLPSADLLQILIDSAVLPVLLYDHQKVQLPEQPVGVGEQGQ